MSPGQLQMKNGFLKIIVSSITFFLPIPRADLNSLILPIKYTKGGIFTVLIMAAILPDDPAIQGYKYSHNYDPLKDTGHQTIGLEWIIPLINRCRLCQPPDQQHHSCHRYKIFYDDIPPFHQMYIILIG